MKPAASKAAKAKPTKSKSAKVKLAKSKTAKSKRAKSKTAKSNAKQATVPVGGGARSPEVKRVTRDLAVLGLARLDQDGQLNVRQREQLRRALATAGEHLGWAMMALSSGNPVDKAAKEITKLTKRGMKTMSEEIADELAGKRTEMSRIEKAGKAIRKLAADAKTTYPADFSYAHTARDVSEGLVTKLEELTFADAGEAEDAANFIDKKIESWGKLREQMIVDLKRKQKRLDELQSELEAFVDYSRGLVGEVLVTLH